MASFIKCIATNVPDEYLRHFFATALLLLVARYMPIGCLELPAEFNATLAAAFERSSLVCWIDPSNSYRICIQLPDTATADQWYLWVNSVRGQARTCRLGIINMRQDICPVPVTMEGVRRFVLHFAMALNKI